MSISTLLERITGAGLRISRQGDNLKLEGLTNAIPPQLVADIRTNKAQLLAWLEESLDTFPLTPLQQAYYRGRDLVTEGGGVANQVYHEIEGVWDIERLEQALQRVVQEHSALRLRINGDDAQYESSELPRIARRDWQEFSDGEQRQMRARLREEKSHQVLSPQDSLLQAEVVILSLESMVLYVNHDGMIVDGISMFLLFRLWHQHYQTPQPQVEYLPFRQHIAVREQDKQHAVSDRSRDYWLRRLESLPKAPALAQNPRPATGAPRFRQHLVTLDAARWQQLQQQAKAQQLTPAAVLMASWAETLYVWGAGEDFTLNVTISERRPIHPRAFSTIGPFSVPMLTEIHLDHQHSFIQRARRLQAQLHQDIDHRYFSGIDVMRELAKTRGLADARMPYTFNCTLGALEGVNGDALTLLGREVYTLSQTPQVLLDAFLFEQQGQLIIRLDGVESAFPEGFLAAMAEGFERMLLSLCQPESWQRAVFDLLPAAQRQRREQINATEAEIPSELLGDAFVIQARCNPDAAAICTMARQIGYGELLNRAAEAAQWLHCQGVKRNELVGLIATRGPEQIIGILAIVLSGACYLPIDASLPEARRCYMLQDGGVRVVLTNVDAAAPLPCFDLRTSPEEMFTLPVRDVAATQDDLAYVLYTSGTTGDPKGVMVTHRNVVNLIADCQRRFSVRPEDRFFAISAFNFDLSVWDIFGALSAGAALVMPDADRAADTQHWAELCRMHQVTVWNSVPAIVRMMFDYQPELVDSLRLIMMSGDRIPPDLPAAMMERRPDIAYWSLGGPTETTIWNICHPISPEDCNGENIPYGRPNANNQCSVRNAQGGECPDWVAGEIYAAGAGITRGYWNDEVRTHERYPVDEHDRQRYFRTGDLGRYLPDGDIDILGRVDLQIKINGYRIEAGEVENVLTTLPEIAQAAVVAAKDAQGDVLVAHLVADGTRPALAELRQRVTHLLPDYMIPAHLVWHEALPLSRNQKVDRKALSQFPQLADEPGGSGSRQANGDIERQLQMLWQDILARDNIGMEQDFFSLGGNSLKALRILTSVRKAFGVAMPLESVYQFNTVQAMAGQIADRGGKL
ncbi:amino acid adenylation domain-containing protein [Salmonella enterica]|nr:amino acid adenylation domain-containing protein [Salmonella enterica]EIE7938865.1 amino acid adenylation domain-containing protein [Salmonella enterica]